MSEKIAMLKGAAGLGDGSDATYEGGPFTNSDNNPIAGDPVLEGALAGTVTDPHAIEGVLIKARVRLQDPLGRTFNHELRWRTSPANTRRLAVAFTTSFAEYTTTYLTTDPDGATWTAAAVQALVIGCELDYTLNPGESFDLRLSEVQVDVYARSWILATTLAGPTAGESRAGAASAGAGAGPQAGESGAGVVAVASLAGAIATETGAD